MGFLPTELDPLDMLSCHAYIGCFSRTTGSDLSQRIVKHRPYQVLGRVYLFGLWPRETWVGMVRYVPPVQLWPCSWTLQVSEPFAFMGEKSMALKVSGSQKVIPWYFFLSFLFGFWFCCNRIKYYLPPLKLSLQMYSVGLPQTTEMRLWAAVAFGRSWKQLILCG